MKNKWTDYELAGLIWNTMYVTRRKFSELDVVAQQEWIQFASTARTILSLEGMSEEAFKELKEGIKL